MKDYRKISASALDPFISVGLDFPSDTIIVSNPTAYSIAINVGSNSRPRGIADCTIPVPPATFLCLPVNGREFALLLTTPTLIVTPQGLPTNATITFTKDEPAPAFGSMPLSGISVDAVILAVQTDRAAGSYNDVINLPASVRSITVRKFGGSISGLYVFGNQTQRYYLSLTGAQGYNLAPGANDSSSFTIPVDSELDSQITVTTVFPLGVNNGYFLIGYQDRIERGVWLNDGRQKVDIFPPGLAMLPVTQTPWAVAPTWEQVTAVNAPPVVAAITSTTIAQAGFYRVEYELSSDDVFAAGRHMRLQHTSAALALKRRVQTSPPTPLIGVWPSVPMVAGDIVSVGMGGTAASGAFAYVVSVRGYKLT